MTAKFGFQVTVKENTIWIFPQDEDAASLAAKAESAIATAFSEEIKKLASQTEDQLNTTINQLPESTKNAVNAEVDELVKNGKTPIEAKTRALVNQGTKTIQDLKAKAKDGIVYAWKRKDGEAPIALGTFNSLLDFIDESIIAKLPKALQPEPKFDVSNEFQKLIGGLPDPINTAAKDLTTKVSFDLEGLRLKIPGKGSKEKFQFEVTIIIDLIELKLDLGPFSLNRLYTQLGNFGTTTPAKSA